MIISKRQLFLLLLLSGYAEAHSQIQKQEPEIKNDSVYQLQEVVVSSRQILGSKFKARNRTGSAYYISPEEMKKFGYTDINRMLKAVPGVNMYEEDGFGLRRTSACAARKPNEANASPSWKTGYWPLPLLIRLRQRIIFPMPPAWKPSKC